MKRIQVEQQLHGYSEGHKLLAGSLELPPDARRTTLLMSDMSGPTMVPGFDSYLTAYPLSSAGLYAVARTWYAPEMARPGCVWTHTLLFRLQDLEKISEASRIMSALHRPDPKGGLDSYKRPVAIVTEPSENSQLTLAAGQLNQVVRALYSNGTQPVVILAREPQPFEDAALGIWLQQWPEFRKRFTFCSGAIGARKLNGNYFDLQVSPHGSLRQLKREMPEMVVVDSAVSLEVSSNAPDWANTITYDLLGQERGGLRSFVSEVAPLIDADRQSFRHLVELHSMRHDSINGKRSLPQLIAQIVERSRTSEDATLLPFIIENVRVLHGMRFPEATKSSILLTLGRIRETLPVPLEKYIPAIVKSLRKDNAQASLHLASDLASGELNGFGEAVLAEIIDTAQPTEIDSLLPNNRQLLYGMVRRRPMLAASTEIWLALKSAHGELIDAVVASRPSEATLRGIMSAMIDANVDSRSVRIIDIAPAVAVDAVLNRLCLSGKSVETMSSAWRRALEYHPDATLGWLNRHADAPLASVAGALLHVDSNSRAVSALSAEMWLGISARVSNEAGSSGFLSLRAFLVSVAFDSNSPEVIPLVEQNFLALHAALAEDRLDPHSWDTLERHLPMVRKWWSWDRCERLRRGVVEFLARNSGSLKSILRDADVRTIRFIAESCRATDEGRQLLNRVLLSDNADDLPQSVRSALRADD
ncbi:MAG: hypothetical protein Q8T11_13735 [Elusimicrobiota bacterium]|nr:hypothetical protein [Elusimicrobiota bacterium]